MQIVYPSHHSWTKPVTPNALDPFGKSARKKLEKTLVTLTGKDVVMRIEPLKEDFLKWFIPMYRARMAEKQNPHIFDIARTTMNGVERNKVYFSLSIFEETVPLGAILFSMRNNSLSVAYRTFLPKWIEADLPASPSLYAEWALADFALKNKVTKLLHGRNRNPYGTNSSIGLALFKLSVGCTPQMSFKATMVEKHIESFTTDVLVMLPPRSDTKRITQALLIAETVNLPRYEQATKYPELLEVEIIKRSI